MAQQGAAQLPGMPSLRDVTSLDPQDYVYNSIGALGLQQLCTQFFMASAMAMFPPIPFGAWPRPFPGHVPGLTPPPLLLAPAASCKQIEQRPAASCAAANIVAAPPAKVESVARPPKRVSDNGSQARPSKAKKPSAPKLEPLARDEVHGLISNVKVPPALPDCTRCPSSQSAPLAFDDGSASSLLELGPLITDAGAEMAGDSAADESHSARAAAAGQECAHPSADSDAMKPQRQSSRIKQRSAAIRRSYSSQEPGIYAANAAHAAAPGGRTSQATAGAGGVRRQHLKVQRAHKPQAAHLAAQAHAENLAQAADASTALGSHESLVMDACLLGDMDVLSDLFTGSHGDSWHAEALLVDVDLLNDH